MATTAWYQGTADAVRKQLFEIRAARTKYVLILAGDHLYRMDFAEMARFHLENGADITVAVQPVLAEDTGRFGILKRDPEAASPTLPRSRKTRRCWQEMVSRDDQRRPTWARWAFTCSIPRYCSTCSNPPRLMTSASTSSPAPSTLNVIGYDFDGYWEDIGTIRSFYETNLALTMPDPPFDFFDPDRPIYTHPRFLPGSTVSNSHLENVLLAEGCCINPRISPIPLSACAARSIRA